MTGHRSARRPFRAARRIGLAALLLVAAAPLQAQQPEGARPLPPVGGAVPAGPPPMQEGPPSVPDAGAAPIGQTTSLAGPDAATLGRELAHDLSPWSMFMNADILVKAVMVGLALASCITWTILLAKSVELGLARAALARSLARVAGGGTLAEAEAALAGRRGVLGRLVAAVSDEVRISPGAPSDGIKERAASRCAEIVKAEGRTARRGMGALATIGAISPFVGLFGTVWGIMNSFIGISKAQTTNLAVVAPGIAEALLATAIGLVAAIPAVIIYNHFARATRGYGDLVQRASGTAMRLLSRDLDRSGGARAFALPRAAE